MLGNQEAPGRREGVTVVRRRVSMWTLGMFQWKKIIGTGRGGANSG